MVLKFKDIDTWKPTSISIVDKPSHPMAVFEVYEDDDEFIKKYVQKEELNLSEQENKSEETVTMSSSFFERIFSGLIFKSEPAPEDKKIEGAATDEVTIEDVMKRIDSLDERFSKVEDTVAELKEEVGVLKEEEPEDKEPETKDSENKKNSDPDLNDMVKKSKGVDPDLNQSEVPHESLMSRIGRSEDGMKW